MAYVVTATWTVQPGHEATVADAIEKLIPLSRQEPGNQCYHPYRDPEVANKFHFFEIYDDEDAYKAHGDSEHFATYGFGQAIPVLENRERAFYETID